MWPRRPEEAGREQRSCPARKPRAWVSSRGKEPVTEAGFLRALGIVGWDALEPAILAALATESPLLLVGPHGSAKTLLLARLAEALGLAFRHYNASILSFDDLLGYPVPQDGRLVYLETPATIWQAEAGALRRGLALPPRAAEQALPAGSTRRWRRGIPLVQLKHRWAAMNPPPGTRAEPKRLRGVRGRRAAGRGARRPLRLRARGAVPRPAERRRPQTSPPRPGPPRARRRTPAPGSHREHESQPRRGRARELRTKAAEYVDVLAAKLAAGGHPSRRAAP